MAAKITVREMMSRTLLLWVMMDSLQFWDTEDGKECTAWDRGSVTQRIDKKDWELCGTRRTR
jgi:hypothetical protein